MSEKKYPGLTKTQVKQLKISQWATANGWRPDPVGRPQLFNVDRDGVRLRIRFFERSITLEKKMPLSEEERKGRPVQNLYWVEVKKRAYSKVSIKKGKLDWGEAESKKKKEEE